ncbi:hypothetical protein PV728_29385 [Streptomyces europaeiscabiei]|uniref:hypothetical protein n=1 Tax=Streptomyces europaeiscabiei TaxID=146819 RepID=UPI0029A1505C|nr:hypothetical protein [Streptomyces europaeiscabiei]MDX3634304.1 hypothetical protein [Streptomyces europaeiscabiei]MDX3651848.1 hypothetical protein [Streptomyces europaeiscabiei]
MTAHPIPGNAGHWWLACGKWRRLHAIPGQAITPEAMRTSIDTACPLPARAACGMRRRWWMPGMFSRLGRRRCTPCCHALGIPTGYGTPVNEASLKENQPA